MVALAEVAQAVGAASGKEIRLVRDRAGWHASPPGQAPAGVHWHWRPPDSPALPPAERVWPLTNEALAHRHCADLDVRQDVQAQRCLTRQAMPEVSRRYTTVHWWPQTA